MTSSALNVSVRRRVQILFVFSLWLLFTTLIIPSSSFAQRQTKNSNPINPLPVVTIACEQVRLEPHQPTENILPPLTSHSPISIQSNSQFSTTATNEFWPGDGSAGNPYIIENYEINRINLTQPCIWINDTTVYFIIRNCTLYGTTTTEDGISLGLVSNGFLFNNTCYNNRAGISLSGGANSITTANNTCSNNSLYGFMIDSTCNNNTIMWSCFSNNLVNVVDDGINSFIDYNYYGDYFGVDGDANGIGDSAHPINGTATNQDLNPLMFCPKPPNWVITPSNQINEFGTNFSYDLDATHAGPIIWALISSPSFTIDSNGRITNSTVLLVNTYPVIVQALNIYGVAAMDSFIVTVRDSTPPSWTVIPVDQTLSYGVELNYQLIATDLSGIDQWFINDTTHFSISSTGRLTNATTVLPDTYGINVTAVDPYNNQLSATFSITVQALNAPVIFLFIFLACILPLIYITREIAKSKWPEIPKETWRLQIENITINGLIPVKENEDKTSNQQQITILGGQKTTVAFNAGIYVNVPVGQVIGGLMDAAVYYPLHTSNLSVKVQTQDETTIEVSGITGPDPHQISFELGIDGVDDLKIDVGPVQPYTCHFTPPVYNHQTQLTVLIKAIVLKTAWKKEKKVSVKLCPPSKDADAISTEPTEVTKRKLTPPARRLSKWAQRKTKRKTVVGILLIITWLIIGFYTWLLSPNLDLLISLSIISISLILIMINLLRRHGSKQNQKIEQLIYP